MFTSTFVLTYPRSSHQDITPNNHKELLAVKELALSTLGYHRRYVPCPAIHPWIDSCMAVPLDRFIAVFKWMLPIYGALHLIPMVLFKRNAFTENPWRMLLRAGWGTTRSSAFLGVFVVIYQSELGLSASIICLMPLDCRLQLSFALSITSTRS